LSYDAARELAGDGVHTPAAAAAAGDAVEPSNPETAEDEQESCIEEGVVSLLLTGIAGGDRGA
jgi:hypothetical protein